MRILASGHPPPLPGFLNSLAGPLDHFGYWAVLLLCADRAGRAARGLHWSADASPRPPHHPQPPYLRRPRTGQGPALQWAALGK